MSPLESQTRSLLHILLIIALPVTILAGIFYLGGKKLEVRVQPNVTGYGEGKVFARPDTAEVTLGVQTGRQTTAERAMEVLSEHMETILKQLKAQGVEEKDVHTTGISLFPAYDWVDGQQIARGFEANENVIVTVRDTSKVGQTIAAATRSGANQILGVRFYIQDMTELRRQARKIAMDKAKEDASELARDLGVGLGRIVSIDQQNSGEQLPMPLMREQGGGGGDVSVPVPAGEQELVVRVALTYSAD